MAKTKIMDLPFPAGGLVRRLAFGAQRPATTPDCSNVRPTDVFDRRRRGGSRPGLEKVYGSPMAGPVQGLFSVSSVSAAGVLSKTLVGIGGGIIYSDQSGNLVAVSATITVNPTLPSIQAVERGQKLYIADWGAARIEGTAGAIAGGILDATGVTWDAHGIDENTDVVNITAGTGTIVNGTYAISDVHATNGLTLVGSPGTGNCTYSVQRGVKVYDPATNELSLLTAITGQVPLGCPCMALYRDRLVLAGPVHLFYESRQSNFSDWNYGADPDDPARATCASLSMSGTPGKPITALIVHGNNCLIFGCEDELWIQRGDIAYGGTLMQLGSDVGVIGLTAWCKLPDFSTVFRSQDGLYVIPGTCVASPLPLSLDLPDELRGGNISGDAVILVYEPEHRGIMVHATPTSGELGDHWWIDGFLASGQPGSGFWPVAFANDDHQPTAILNFDPGLGLDRKVLIGCHDGYIRQHSDAVTDDDGTAIASYVCYTPFRPGANEYMAGLVRELIGTIDSYSDPVTWDLYSAATVQEVLDAVLDEIAAQATGTWIGGRVSVDARVCDGVVMLKLSSTGQWAAESVALIVQPAGRQRMP